MILRGIVLIIALSGCDMVMKTDVKQIPDGFEIEQSIYVHGRFPDCYSSVSKISKKSNQAFLNNSNAFTFSQHRDRQYKAWEPTPIPKHYLSEDGMINSPIILNVIESGVNCFEETPKFINEYEDIYWDALEKKGAFYTFSESHHTFMLYIPGERLLVHTIR